MSFDTKKFMQSNLKFREQTIKVPELKDFFEGEPVWKIRNLSAQELAQVNDEIKNNRDIGSIISGLVSNDSSEKVAALKNAFGMSDEVPDDAVRRIKMLELASIDPVVTQDLCVRLATYFSTQFFLITNKILELTGKGSVLGE